MCLDRVEKRLKPTNEERGAYGVFMFDPQTGKLKTPYLKEPVLPNKWMSARNKSSWFTWNADYPVGFHKLTNKRQAQRLWIAHRPGAVILPVLLRKVHTIGREGNRRVYVAAEMKVLRRDVDAAKRKRRKP